MTHATCCEQGKLHVVAGDTGWAMVAQRYPLRIDFCPFCGSNLNPLTLEQALRLLAESEEKLTICFDVDGVLCDDRDATVPYDERVPYPWARDILSLLRSVGHTIHIQTARYMEKFGGDQQLAIRQGEFELRNWLRFHNIPFDMAYCGKASAHIYADDRGCRIASNRGTIEWANTLLPLINKIQRERSERANVRV